MKIDLKSNNGKRKQEKSVFSSILLLWNIIAKENQIQKIFSVFLFGFDHVEKVYKGMS